jgi:DivIVA domain-containing protein
MPVTVDDIKRVEFTNAPIGRRGYAKNEVNAFIERVAKTLVNEDDLTSAEVHHVMFGKPPIGKRGYDEKEVDDFLDMVEETLAARSGTHRQAHRVPSSRDQDQATDERAPRNDRAGQAESSEHLQGA